MVFNRIVQRSFRLLICSYLSIKHWGLCCWNPPWWYSLFSNSTRKQQKAAKNSRKLELSHNTVLCAKSLIWACAYVGFFPVKLFISIIITLFNYFYSYEFVVTRLIWWIPPGVLHLYCVIISRRKRLIGLHLFFDSLFVVGNTSSVR